MLGVAYPRGALCAFAVYVALPVLCVMYVLCMRFVPTSVVYVACISRIYHITVVCVRFIGVGCRVSRIGVFGFVSVGLDDFFWGKGGNLFLFCIYCIYSV